MKETKERIIYNTLYNVNDWRKDFKEYCEINGLDEDNENIHDFIVENLNDWFYHVINKFNKPIDGDILVIADLALWNGRHSGYEIIHASKLNDIFNVCENYDDVKFYYDRYNVKADLYHHDGCNHVEFRLIKKNKNIQPLLDKLYNQKECSREEIRNYTTSLREVLALAYN